jgi:hypothetical protein
VKFATCYQLHLAVVTNSGSIAASGCEVRPDVHFAALNDRIGATRDRPKELAYTATARR